MERDSGAIGELLARVEALSATVAAQGARLEGQEAVIARQGAELAALRGRPDPATAPGGSPVVSAAGTPGRRAALRRLLLAGAGAVGLLAAAREPRAAHAIASGDFVNNANGQFGLAAGPSGIGAGTISIGTTNHGVIGVIGTSGVPTAIHDSGVLGQVVGVGRSGVQGLSPDGFGVVGASANAGGVGGQGGTIGVIGVCPSPTGVGVQGNSKTGVLGNGSQFADGVGVRGRSFGNDQLGAGTGVRGESGTGTGVWGSSAGNFTQGVLGEGTGQAHGVTGTSINAFGLSGTSTNAKGFVGVNTNGNDFAGLFIGHGANPNNFTAPGIYVKGRAVITGGIAASAITSQGPRLLHAIQAADELHEDVGRGQLQGGRARVNLDPLFAETIKADDYHVFLTPRGAETKGLAIVAQDGRGFSVHEAQGGTGSYPFDWRVVAERKGAPPGSRLMRHEGVDVRRVLEQLPARPTADAPDRPEPPTQRSPAAAPPVPPPPEVPPSTQPAPRRR